MSRMTLLGIALLSAAFLLAAYRLYGRLLARLLRLDPERETPAVALRDDLDYAPIAPRFLLSQHFSAIAAAGPIVGPILAGVMFGWAPALIWILVGAVFIGGVHDLTALVASVRHNARSIAEVVKEHMSPRSYLLFLAFIWIALVYIIVAFTDITARSFIGTNMLEGGTVVTGAGIATSSLLYLALPIAMALLLRYGKMPLGLATAIFLPLVGVIIWVGQKIPLDLAALLGVSDAEAHKVWDVLLLGYCLIAAVVPVWLLLQPRGHLGGYFLLFALAAGAAGLLFSGEPIRYPAFTAWETAKGDTLFPMLFITIACGACSGFHALIASGTTSKQLRRETDAKPVAYGSMLLEAMVAVISLSCVMILATEAPILKEPVNAASVYAHGIGRFLGVFGVSASLGVAFGYMAFTTFVYDTLDVCTRLGRYIIQELIGRRDWIGKWIGTALTAGAPLFFILRTVLDAEGKEIPAYRTFWPLFGASNQLLAALTLLGVTVWLWRTRRARWVWAVLGLPTAWMYLSSVWALAILVVRDFQAGKALDPVPWVGCLLIALAALMLLEACWILFGSRPTPPAKQEPLAAPA
jgi:carbon starvation protein